MCFLLIEMTEKLTRDKIRDVSMKLVPAVNIAIEYKRKNPYCVPEEVIDSVTKYASVQKSELVKFSMISSASKVIDLIDRNPKLNDKEVISKVMLEFPKIIEDVFADYPK